MQSYITVMYSGEAVETEAPWPGYFPRVRHPYTPRIVRLHPRSRRT